VAAVVTLGRWATLPRDLVDEVEQELGAARAAVAQDRARVVALEELHALALALSAGGRPATVPELLSSARDAADRDRRTRLVRLLR